MYRTSQQMHSGQSWTLDVHREDSGETVVKCPSVPEVGEVRDPDPRYAVQHMKRLLDDHVHRGYSETRPMIAGRGELLDE